MFCTQAACKVQCQPELQWRLESAISISTNAPLPCCWLQMLTPAGALGKLPCSHRHHCTCAGLLAPRHGAVSSWSSHPVPTADVQEAHCKVLLPTRALLHFPAGISSIAYVLDSFVAGAITWMAAVSFKAAASAETRQQLPHVFQVLPTCQATWPTTFA